MKKFIKFPNSMMSMVSYFLFCLMSLLIIDMYLFKLTFLSEKKKNHLVYTNNVISMPSFSDVRNDVLSNLSSDYLSIRI